MQTPNILVDKDLCFNFVEYFPSSPPEVSIGLYFVSTVHAQERIMCTSIVKIPKQCTLLTYHCHILFGTLCEALQTLPSFGGDLAFILSREDSCYCQGVYIRGQLSVD